jgi:hypothetical protein
MDDPTPQPLPDRDATSPAASPSAFERGARRSFDWMFRNRQTGEITIAQAPNVSLWAFLATVVVRWFVPSGSGLRTAVDVAGAAALAWWSLDEVLRGVNPWRRVLGIAGCIAVVGRVAALVR